MPNLNLYQFVEVARITGTNSGTSSVMTGVSTGRSRGKDWVDCPFRVLGVYVNFADGTGARQTVSSGVSIVVKSASGVSYDTPIIDELLSDEFSFVFIPDSTLIIPSDDYLLVNMGSTKAETGMAFTTIHIGY